MTFHSILFATPENQTGEGVAQAPDFFQDLNLDQIVEAVTAGKEEYNLKPFFYQPLRTLNAITYRQEILKDLEKKALYKCIQSFALKMRNMREHLEQADKLYYKYQKERWFLDAVDIYCDAVKGLSADLADVGLKAIGFLGLNAYLQEYIGSKGFRTLVTETKKLKVDLANVKYGLIVNGNSLKVRHYEWETDYSAEVEATFKKFQQGAVKDYRVEFYEWNDMNHIEAKILEFVAQLFPDVFANLDDYCIRYQVYMDQTIATFDREVQFYLAYLEHFSAFKEAGLKFCYPVVSQESKEVYAYDSFDLALAQKLRKEKKTVVCNDFYLQGKERIFVISGPNQGGKTTFARTFGQLHYLACLGCPVPAREAQLFLFDRLFTHFEREENIKNLIGKLQDDLIRIHGILKEATTNSIIIMNEIFSSTTLRDAVFLGGKVMEKMMALDLLGVCVTFIDELANLGEKVVSMVSTIVPGNPALRTFKVLRRPADGLSYALSIAEKYRLTYDCLKERIK